MSARVADILRRPQDTAEFKLLLERLRWGSGTAGEVLGRNERTIKRWRNGVQNVEPTDLAFMRHVGQLVDRAAFLQLTTPPGTMTGDSFREIVNMLGWEVRPRDLRNPRLLATPEGMDEDDFAAAFLALKWERPESRRNEVLFSDVALLSVDEVIHMAMGLTPIATGIEQLLVPIDVFLQGQPVRGINAMKEAEHVAA